eukprot:Nk52_evm13s304 gene=Nk52_evmTU13s304
MSYVGSKLEKYEIDGYRAAGCLFYRIFPCPQSKSNPQSTSTRGDCEKKGEDGTSATTKAERGVSGGCEGWEKKRISVKCGGGRKRMDFDILEGLQVLLVSERRTKEGGRILFAVPGGKRTRSAVNQHIFTESDPRLTASREFWEEISGNSLMHEEALRAAGDFSLEDALGSMSLAEKQSKLGGNKEKEEAESSTHAHEPMSQRGIMEIISPTCDQILKGSEENDSSKQIAWISSGKYCLYVTRVPSEHSDWFTELPAKLQGLPKEKRDSESKTESAEWLYVWELLEMITGKTDSKLSRFLKEMFSDEALLDHLSKITL